MVEIGLALTLLLGAYLAGAIPTGYWLGKITKGIDIREVGSGSTGATNVLRCVGKKEALFVLIFDIAKGYLPVYGAEAMEASHWSSINGLPPHMISVLAAFLAIFGHSRSIFLGFQGGKSAATTLGTLLALHPLTGICTFGTWLLVLALTKIVSLASIIAAIACPCLFMAFGSPATMSGFALAACILVLIRHKANISRLLAGTEPKIGKKAQSEQECASALSRDEKDKSTEPEDQAKAS